MSEREELVRQLRVSGTDVLAVMLSVPNKLVDPSSAACDETVQSLMKRLGILHAGFEGQARTRFRKPPPIHTNALARKFMECRADLVNTISATADTYLRRSTQASEGPASPVGRRLVDTACRGAGELAVELMAVISMRPSASQKVCAAILLAAEEAAQRCIRANESDWQSQPGESEWSAANIAGHVVELMPYWAQLTAEATSVPGMVLGRATDAPERLGAVAQGDSLSQKEAADAMRKAAGVACASIRRIADDQWTITVATQRYGELAVQDCLQQLIVQHVWDHSDQIETALRAVALGRT